MRYHLDTIPVWDAVKLDSECVLCELRSSRLNINRIAVKYGGGGHQKASGATLKSRAEAMQMLSDLDQMAEENA